MCKASVFVFQTNSVRKSGRKTISFRNVFMLQPVYCINEWYSYENVSE